TARGGMARAAGEGYPGGEEATAWVQGTTVPGTIPELEPGEHPHTDGPHRKVDVPRHREPDPEGVDPLDPVGGDGAARRRPRGGFSVKFRNLGEDQDRSRYDMERKTIYINLDHPAVAAALGSGGVEETTFRRLSYEIAFTEYAI